MIMDSQLSFVPVRFNQSLVAAAGIAIPSVNVIDILGQGVGTAPPNIFGNRTIFGSDTGIGDNRPLVEVLIGILPVTANSATLNVAFQAAPDTGLAGGYQPGTWQTLVETGPITAAQMAAVSGNNAVLARFDLPPAFPANLSPRFLRLLFQIPTGTNFTAGTIASATVTMVRDDQANRYAAKNFTVA